LFCTRGAREDVPDFASSNPEFSCVMKAGGECEICEVPASS